MRIEENVNIGPYTTMRIGGGARYLCVARTEEDLRAAADFANKKQLPIMILGGGSNVLVNDDGFPGLIVINRLIGITESISGEKVIIESKAGESWDGLVSYSVNKGYWGIENLSHIPGSVGAAPIQNIGAYGAEVKESIVRINAIDMKTGKSLVMTSSDCLFGYRDSVFKKPEYRNIAITSVTFELSLMPKPNLSYKDIRDRFDNQTEKNISLSQIRDAIIDIRKAKFPDLSKVGTAGSFWKNPVITADEYESLKNSFPLVPSYPAPAGKIKVSLAWILDKVCSLKGYSKGKVKLFENQPLVLVADLGAKSSDVDEFAKEVESVVNDKTGLPIEREVVMF